MKKVIILLLALITLPLASKPVQAKKTSKIKTVQVKKKTAKKTSKKKSSKSKKTASIKIIKTISSKSYVVLNKKTNFLTLQNKRTKSVARKGQGYRVYYLRFGKQAYYGTKNKKWLPASATYGTVWYGPRSNQMILSTSKKGKLSYSIYDPAATVSLTVKHNSYVYNDRGMLNHGTIKVVKKGSRVKGYSLHKINGINFYLTNKGWLKAANLAKTKK